MKKEKKYFKKLQMAAIVCTLTLAVTACGAAESAKADTNKTGSVEAGTDKEESAASNSNTASKRSSLLGAFQTETAQGDTVIDQSIFANADVTMVNVWATFCGSCIKEMPDIAALAKDYEDTNVQVIGLVSDVTETGDETALDIIESTGTDYTNLIMSENMLQSLGRKVQIVPTAFFLDKEGNIIGTAYPGVKDKDEWTAVIEAVKKEA